MSLNKPFDQYLKFVGRLIPKPKKNPVIGIDIGTSSVKAIDLVHTGNKPEIRNWAIETIDGGDAKTALKKITARLKLSNQELVCAVSGKGSLIRYIDMPRMPLEDLRKSFVFELDKYFPFDPQTIYSDCSILDPQSSDKKMQVLIAAVKKEIVDERMKLFKDAGLDLGRITLNAIATANAFSVLGPQAARPVNATAVLDIGGTVSSLIIFKEGSPRFTRDIFIGSHEMTKQVANALGVSLAEAEKIKCQPGEKLAQVLEAVDTPINNLISEIRLSMDYFMTEKNAKTDEIFLFGGGSLLKGIEEVFSKPLGIPVRVWNPLNQVQVNSQAPSDIQTYAAQFGVALGLGLS